MSLCGGVVLLLLLGRKTTRGERDKKFSLCVGLLLQTAASATTLCKRTVRTKSDGITHNVKFCPKDLEVGLLCQFNGVMGDSAEGLGDSLLKSLDLLFKEKRNSERHYQVAKRFSMHKVSGEAKGRITGLKV